MEFKGKELSGKYLSCIYIICVICSGMVGEILTYRTPWTITEGYIYKIYNSFWNLLCAS